ncbi:hypothetical protein K227x_44070 [Rubripirellula lacrimiformis]|uniref:Uncharacterized protein n=1 Tax=Rubripirellula lacrimiformis TaxID=1930273 RepID=A0A517NFU7_9BACT|nr:hypothetical protein K227x_44070 [Rubripirellula lacrimiformis]
MVGEDPMTYDVSREGDKKLCRFDDHLIVVARCGCILGASMGCPHPNTPPSRGSDSIAIAEWSSDAATVARSSSQRRYQVNPTTTTFVLEATSFVGSPSLGRVVTARSADHQPSFSALTSSGVAIRLGITNDGDNKTDAKNDSAATTTTIETIVSRFPRLPISASVQAQFVICQPE